MKKIIITLCICVSIFSFGCSEKEDYIFIHHKNDLYLECNRYFKDNKLYLQPHKKDFIAEIQYLSTPGRWVIDYEREGIDIDSLQVVFYDEGAFSRHTCYYKDKNYLYWESLQDDRILLFSWFDYESIEIITGIIHLPEKENILTTCPMGGCFKDKDASYYRPGGTSTNSDFFVLPFLRDFSKQLPIESNYDPFRINLETE